MRLGVFLPLDAEKMKLAKGYGFECCQLHSFDPSEYTDEKAAELLSTGLEATAFFAGWRGYHSFAYPEMYRTVGFMPRYLRELRMNDVLAGAAFAEKLGVRNVFTHIGYVPDDPANGDRMEIVTILRYIASELKKSGQSLQIETGEMIPTSLMMLIRDIGLDNVGVNFDPANFLINGRANPTDAARLLKPYVRGMHAKDALPTDGSGPKGKEVVIGSGAVDFRAILKTFSDCGIDVTVEREISGDKQFEDIMNAKVYLENIMREEEI